MKIFTNYLKSQGINSQIELEPQDGGGNLEKMAEAVENSVIIIIALSQAYFESQNCRSEAQYAYNLKKNLIFLMTEDGFQPRGWLGLLVGADKCYTPWNQAGGLQEASMTEIVKLIQNSLKEPAQTIGNS